jgi:hypothetical protein
MRSRKSRQDRRWNLIAGMIGAVVALGILYLFTEGTIFPEISGLGPWLGASLGASIGAGLTYILTRHYRREEDNQRRQALAAMLLYELQALEQTLTDIRRKLEPLGNTEITPFQTRIYDQAGANVLLFRSKTVLALMAFYGLVYELREMLADVKGIPEAALKLSQEIGQSLDAVQLQQQLEMQRLAAQGDAYSTILEGLSSRRLQYEKLQIDLQKYMASYRIAPTRHRQVHQQAILAAKAIQNVAQQLQEVEGGEGPPVLQFPVPAKPWIDHVDTKAMGDSPAISGWSSTEFSLPDWPRPTFKHSNLWAERARCTLCQHIMPAWHAKTGERDSQMLLTHLYEKAHRNGFEIFEAIDDKDTPVTGPHGSEKTG